jgi:hypothetical protein
MDPLIEAAKQKLWDLVNTLARAKPTPQLRVALYSYGHNGYDANKGWVRQELDFGTDLDLVFKKLTDLKTAPAGSQEYVARVCRDALRDLKWSERPDALKLLFVCGNEPASQDPTLKMADVAAQAVKQGIIINPIYCGSANHPDARDWQELAGLAKGSFASIDHQAPVAIATPFDQKLAALANAVNATYVPYGAQGKLRAEFQADRSRDSAKLGTANLAARVITQNGALYYQGGWDLVDRMKREKDFDVTKLADAELPENMRKMSAEERVRYVREMQEKRAAIQHQVEELSRQRQIYLNEQLHSREAEARRNFGIVLEQTIRRQAAEKKIHIPE